MLRRNTVLFLVLFAVSNSLALTEDDLYQMPQENFPVANGWVVIDAAIYAGRITDSVTYHRTVEWDVAIGTVENESEEIELEGKFGNMGAQMVREVAIAGIFNEVQKLAGTGNNPMTIKPGIEMIPMVLKEVSMTKDERSKARKWGGAGRPRSIPSPQPQEDKWKPQMIRGPSIGIVF